MTQDEVLETLHRVVAENMNYTTWTVSTPHLVALVNLAIEKEREACAKVCEEQMQGKSIWIEGARACSLAIRARSKDEK